MLKYIMSGFQNGFTLLSIDSVRAMMIVWRLGGKIIRTGLCCVVYDSCTQ